MYYNIAFDVSTLLIILGIIVSNLITIKAKERASRSFNICIILLFTATSFDILAAVTGSGLYWKNDDLNVLFETAYLCTGLYSLYAAFLVVANRIKANTRVISQVVFALVSVYTFLLWVNYPTHVVFNIIDGKYDTKLLFYLLYCVPVLVMVLTVGILVTHRRSLSKSTYIAMLLGVMAPITGVIIQFINDRLILIQFGLALLLLFINFIWETPDSQRLEEAVVQLKETKQAEANFRMEMELTNRVKSRFLENISDELLSPVSEIQLYTDQILQAEKNETIRNNAQQISNACDQFRELLFQIND